jgi:hypothetical protein
MLEYWEWRATVDKKEKRLFAVEVICEWFCGGLFRGI